MGLSRLVQCELGLLSIAGADPLRSALTTSHDGLRSGPCWIRSRQPRRAGAQQQDGLLQTRSRWRRLRRDPWLAPDTQSLFESALSRTYANSAVSVLSLEQALACKTGCPLLAQSLWARFRQPRRQGFLGQAIEIPHSNRLLEKHPEFERHVEPR